MKCQFCDENMCCTVGLELNEQAELTEKVIDWRCRRCNHTEPSEIERPSQHYTK